ncbi:MAG: hypothetical protein QF437_02995 [Planctomycetota bacterium]|jgi:hypothetical protein|nr:hypothetical protein [Planctomycetota bacterium]MDP7129424.1 hypothetical protein [Planctomycetota bacterium]MDP7249273.1 hypothetical protein [Planctomycetota bacterium]
MWTNINRKASALVEFLVILPVFVLLLLGLIYLGEVAILGEKSIHGSSLASFHPGDQSEGFRESGYVSNEVFQGFEGSYRVKESKETLPEPDAIERILYPPPVSREKEPVKPRARGHTGIDLDTVFDDLETIIIGEEGSPGRAVPPPVKDAQLLEVMETQLHNWYARTRTRTEFEYEPDYLTLYRTGITPSGAGAGHTVNVRTEKVRRARDEQGEHLAPELINSLNDGTAPTPGYPTFKNFDARLMAPN